VPAELAERRDIVRRPGVWQTSSSLREMTLDICLFWHGARLRRLDRLCVASMVLTGQRTVLYSYEPVADVPEGVVHARAQDVIPEAEFRAKVGSGEWSLNQFSDIFRVTLMKQGRGVWLDTDIYLARPFLPDPGRHFLAWENGHRFGVSALYFPPDSPVIRAFDDYLASGEVVPPWLGFRRRVGRPLWLRLRGKPVRPSVLGITIFANDGISRLFRRFGLESQVAPKGTFYYWNGKDSARVYDPAFGLEPTRDPDFMGFHFAKKWPHSEEAPRPGSFFHWVAGQVAHLP